MANVKSSEDYLEAVLIVLEQKGICRAVDIARQLGFSKPSVSNAMAKLESAGYLKRDADGFITLTEKGSDTAGRTLEKHRFFRALFTGLGVNAETAEKDACAMEHSISEESYQALRGFMAEKYTGMPAADPGAGAEESSCPENC